MPRIFNILETAVFQIQWEESGSGKERGKGGLKPECVLTDGHIDCVLGPSDLSVYNLLGLVITVCQGLLGETKEEEEGQQASPCL